MIKTSYFCDNCGEEKARDEVYPVKLPVSCDDIYAGVGKVGHSEVIYREGELCHRCLDALFAVNVGFLANTGDAHE